MSHKSITTNNNVEMRRIEKNRERKQTKCCKQNHLDAYQNGREKTNQIE